MLQTSATIGAEAALRGVSTSTDSGRPDDSLARGSVLEDRSTGLRKRPPTDARSAPALPVAGDLSDDDAPASGHDHGHGPAGGDHDDDLAHASTAPVSCDNSDSEISPIEGGPFFQNDTAATAAARLASRRRNSLASLAPGLVPVMPILTGARAPLCCPPDEDPDAARHHHADRPRHRFPLLAIDESDSVDPLPLAEQRRVLGCCDGSPGNSCCGPEAAAAALAADEAAADAGVDEYDSDDFYNMDIEESSSSPAKGASACSPMPLRVLPASARFDVSKIRGEYRGPLLENHRILFDIEQVPGYLACNPFILTGYRWRYTFSACLRSAFTLHNETINIWSHLLAVPVVWYMFFDRLFNVMLPLQASWVDISVQVLYLIGITDVFLWRIVIFLCLLTIGGVFFVSYFPERCCPGTFDIFGASHQLWHIAIVFALSWWQYVGVEWFRFHALRAAAAGAATVAVSAAATTGSPFVV
ncbi:hypothetical protein H696_00851 [Fonticula alba]|uniref:Progestin and adipoQ receptor family member 3 n=1 Tax=Fonticula alba TaxID=691883 RepID=A0A058ZFY9_FONAL|nr:hypothetical protein H696_00851 [Fonticula alba]KCV73310.1 hypothetical protein H696_00851 [Fonticula alba]|eukprot:XP_009493011.1 hypothetical protein H696_00851 [Fonticula alba]